MKNVLKILKMILSIISYVGGIARCDIFCIKKQTMFFSFVVYFLFTLQVYATTYYVDYENGVDTNTGTSIGTAFKHCPGDSNATNNALLINLIPGDTVIFKGGSTYSGEITVNRSGSIENYISYRGNTPAGDWGVGKAKLDLKELYFHAFNGYGSYIKVLNFDIYSVKRVSTETQRGTIRVSGGHDWLIQDCIFSRTEGWDMLCAQGSDESVYADQTQIFLRTAGTDNFEINNCEFYAVGRDCIYMFRSDNVKIHDCNFGGINRGIQTGYFSVALRITYSSHNIQIYDNIFHDGWQYEGDDPGQRCHAGDWLHIYGNSNAAEYPHDILIEGNSFYNNRDFQNPHGTAFSFMHTGVNNITWRNNTFINPHAYNGTLLTQFSELAPDKIYIYNNTFVNYNTGLCMKIGLGSGSDFEVKNNIFVQYNSASSACLEVFDAGWAGTISNNVYYRPNNESQTLRQSNTWYSLDQWKALGYDANSSYGNPNLVNIPSNGELSSSGNYRLSNGSLNSINTGATISGFNSDKDDVLRPQSASWDIGAYEYFVMTLAPPQNVRVESQ
ncbi:valyl-tRNA synthetase [Candidatus Scalindua japonica]|uniref:Valyl-tRNA synthetase n=1 Tax=Candidatus Scalindua japonica TaxID=1284222 RepID=A0A286TZD5_9BACT|nr:right-handed parallel beta-helix repeat-containing protein [Candidatus Scalindua japonica]GAX61226.1 valyl-tRNA synthetase [Candidatus Scalindua japonica]